MKKTTKDDFSMMTLAEKGMIIMNNGKHLTQISKGNYLLNLYLFEDFFVEIFYSISTNKIDKIEIMTDLSRIDEYIDDIIKPSKEAEKLQLN
ncbi:MAG: hypothetical protein RBT49_13400 [Bacteroidales bacterium]|jgi:hypothetical protein|nr:hypothetical protein [Bacteroidales bacterium]